MFFMFTLDFKLLHKIAHVADDQASIQLISYVFTFPSNVMLIKALVWMWWFGLFWFLQFRNKQWASQSQSKEPEPFLIVRTVKIK